MPIIIENVSGDVFGVCKYTVKINDNVVTTFEHNRKYGLAGCLKNAASAVKFEMSAKNGKYLRRLRDANGMTLKEVSDISGKSIGYIRDMIEVMLEVKLSRKDYFRWMRDNGI